MTMIAQLDLDQDPAVVTMLWLYGVDAVPEYMVEPEYVDVTEVDPPPQIGYTYDGETFAPGAPQALEANRQQAAANAQAAIDANEAYLALEDPALDEIHAQVASLTAHVNALTKQRLYQFDSERYPYMEEGLPGYPAPPQPPDEPPPVDTPPKSRTLDSIDPTEGYRNGGTLVTLKGSGLTDVSSVLFATEQAATYEVVDDETITCTTPPWKKATVDVTVSGGSLGDAVLTAGFTYT
jgi:hypothetical protein